MSTRRSPFTSPADKELWRLFDEKRYRERKHLDFDTLKAISDSGIRCDWRAVDVLNTELGSEATISPVLPQQIEIVKVILGGQNEISVFDPWAQHGGLICALLEQGIVKRGVGITLNINQVQIFRLISQGLEVEIIYQDPFRWLSNSDGQFELITSMPPIGLGTQTLEIPLNGIEHRICDDTGHLLLFESCRRLKPFAKGIFVVPPTFASNQQPDSVRRSLFKFGLSIEAYFALPSDILFPLTGLTAAAIVVISNETRKELFTAQLTEDRKRNLSILENYIRGKSGSSLSHGMIVPECDFDGYYKLSVSEQILLKAKRTGLKAQLLGNLALDFIRPDNSPEGNFQEAENSVYFPVIGEQTEVFSSLQDLRGKTDRYVQIILDRNIAISDYVSQFFNTDLGRTCRAQLHTGEGIPRISFHDLPNISIYLPTLEDQKEIIRINRKILETRSSLETLKSELWDYPRNHRSLEQELAALVNENPLKASMEAWCDSLPFPLSTILWTYQVSGKDEKRRYESLLHFFEALSEFWSTVLLSALEISDDFAKAQRSLIRDTFQNQGLTLDRSSFGCWQIICSLLAKQFRRHFAKNRKLDPRMYFKTADHDILAMLTSKKLVSMLQEINHLRNIWAGHGGIVSTKSAVARHEKLLNHLVSLRNIFGTVWQRLSLIRPGSTTFCEGIYDYEIEVLSGSRSPFKIEYFEMLEPLNQNALYLFDHSEKRALQLLPIFKIVASPSTAQNACYFYNRIESNGTRLVSYHFEAEEELIDKFEDTTAAIRGLG